MEMVGASKKRNANGTREYTYQFPELDEARGIFASWARLGDDFKWEEA